jgi:hypothetical protein
MIRGLGKVLQLDNHVAEASGSNQEIEEVGNE